jgi:hypothetical protein
MAERSQGRREDGKPRQELNDLALIIAGEVGAEL